jgi:hypothetical protein
MGDPSMGLPMMAEGGFVPKITTNQQYDQTFTVSGDAQNPDTPMSPISGQKGSGVSMNKANSLAGSAAGVVSSLAALGPKDPYAVEGTHEGVQIADSTIDAVMNATPIAGFWQLGNAGADLAEAGRADMRSQGNKEGSEAAAFAKGFSNPAGQILDNANLYEQGVYTAEDVHRGNVLDVLLFPGAGSLANEIVGAEQKGFERLQQQKEFDLALANRDFGGSDMEAQGPRDRYMKYGGKRVMSGGGKRYMNNGGDKDEIRPNQEDFLYGESMRLFDPSSRVTGTHVFSMADNEPLDYEGQDDEFSQKHRANILKDHQQTIPQLSTAPTYSVYGNAQGPNTPMSMIGSSGKTNKTDWANIGESVGMGLLGNVGNLAYLFDEGKDYDKVSYGRYNPDTVNASSSRRAIRDAMATSKEALRESGRLDRSSLAQLGTQSAKQLADAEERVRLTNTGMLNNAQLKNLDIDRIAQDETARNKGAALTNYYNALNALGQNTQAAGRGYNLRMSDAEKQRLVAENNAQLQEYLKEFKTV